MADLPLTTCASCMLWRPDGDLLLPDPPPPRGGPIYGGPPPQPREGNCILDPPTTYPVARADGTAGLLSVWARTREDEACGGYEPVPTAEAPVRFAICECGTECPDVQSPDAPAVYLHPEAENCVRSLEHIMAGAEGIVESVR